MIKASQEKQVFVCTSTKKISIAITKVHSERKKKSVAKAAPDWHPICGAQTKQKPNQNPRNLPTKKHCLYSYFIWKLLLFIR